MSVDNPDTPKTVEAYPLDEDSVKLRMEIDRQLLNLMRKPTADAREDAKLKLFELVRNKQALAVFDHTEKLKEHKKTCYDCVHEDDGDFIPLSAVTKEMEERLNG